MEWQPIETAPKSGKLFDVWCVDPKCSAIGVRFTDVAMRGDQSGLGYLTNTGEWEYLEEDGVYPPWQPTHWMPLPEPPK